MYVAKWQLSKRRNRPSSGSPPAHFLPLAKKQLHRFADYDDYPIAKTLAGAALATAYLGFVRGWSTERLARGFHGAKDGMLATKCLVARLQPRDIRHGVGGPTTGVDFADFGGWFCG